MYEKLGKRTLQIHIPGRARSGHHIAQHSSPTPPGTGGPHSTSAGTQSIPSITIFRMMHPIHPTLGVDQPGCIMLFSIRKGFLSITFSGRVFGIHSTF